MSFSGYSIVVSTQHVLQMNLTVLQGFLHSGSHWDSHSRQTSVGHADRKQNLDHNKSLRIRSFLKMFEKMSGSILAKVFPKN